MRSILNYIVLLSFMVISLEQLCAQANSEKTYDVFRDTLIIIGNQVINKEKILLTREVLLNSDTIRINQKGLTIGQFSFYAIALGKSVNLTSNQPLLTNEMRNEIRNNNPNYKIIYLKDIILRTKDGREVKPSVQTLKIIFLN
jgi:hypothetical protein